MPPKNDKNAQRGKLRIGDDWNAIRIIALTQGNPLKAIAELVENSIDARAKTITITRGREHGEHYLSIRDDGAGVPRDAEGLPDFKYVATHGHASPRRAGRRRRGRQRARLAGLYLRASCRRALAQPLRRRSQSHHRQQRPSRSSCRCTPRRSSSREAEIGRALAR
jgi:hypothetical protein